MYSCQNICCNDNVIFTHDLSRKLKLFINELTKQLKFENTFEQDINNTAEKYISDKRRIPSNCYYLEEKTKQIQNLLDVLIEKINAGVDSIILKDVKAIKHTMAEAQIPIVLNHQKLTKIQKK